MDPGLLTIDELVLRSPDRSASARFLRSRLATVEQAPVSHRAAGVRYVPPPAEPKPVSATEALSAFWKFSVFTDDLDQLRHQLLGAGTEVSEPVQFGEIGYLCHLTEPGGNEIELLGRTFLGTPPPQPASADTLGLITLRVTDLAAALQFYERALGMQLLCEMAVDDGRADPFDLYFLAPTDDVPPDSNKASVNNRQWLYQRPYSIIELQHYRPPSPAIATDPGSPRGLAHIGLTTPSLSSAIDRLRESDVEVATSGRTARFASPDGHWFELTGRASP